MVFTPTQLDLVIGPRIGEPACGGVGAHVRRDAHRAELRAAHGAEVGRLGRLGGQGGVVVAAGGVGVEGEVELVLPPELEAGLRERVVPVAGVGVALGDVGGVRGDLVGDHALLHVIAIGEAEMILGGHVAEHRRAVQPTGRGADGGGAVVVAGAPAGGERAHRVYGR